jgi:hypothetical protein
MSTVTFSVARNDIKNVVDENGDLSQVAVNVPSFEYNANGTYKGMLVEQTSTNEIRNSEGGGSTNGVIGSGGVLPTNWGVFTLNGLSAEVIGTGTEKGVEYVDLKFSGTATATASFNVRFESSSQISALQNEIWSGSVFMKYTDQTANPDLVRLGIQQFDSIGTFLAQDTETITLTNTLTRFKQENITLSNASTDKVTSNVFFSITNTQAYDFTVRFGLPQLEKHPSATSVIKTTNASVERLRDVINNTSATSYIGQTSGTVYVEVQIDNLSDEIKFIIQAAESTTASDNAVNILLDANNNFSFRLDADNGLTDIDIATPASTGNHKLAFVYASGDVRVYLDGSQVSTTNTSSWSFGDTLSQITVGNDSGFSQAFDNWIRAFAFYKRALTDNEAKILTQ